MLVGLEFNAKFVVEDPQIAGFIANGRSRLYLLDFLGDYANVRAIAAVVAKLVIAKAIGEMAK